MIGQSCVIKFVLSGILLFGIGIIVLNFNSYNRHQSDAPTFTKKDSVYNPPPSVDTVGTEDFKSNIKPAQLTVDNIPKVMIRKYKVSSKNEKNKNIPVRESGKGKYNVLLLHGQRFSSKTWEDIGTIQYLSNWGYRVFAVDIPYNKNNSLPKEREKEAAQWLKQLINTLHLKNLVIISPSMSGRFSLPYIFQLDESQKLIKGFVAIAPVGTEKYKTENYQKIKIPTLIVHGEKDTQYASAMDNLKLIPKSETLVINGASHSSYYDKPMEFHNGLRQFLYKIYRPIYENEPKSSNKEVPVSNTTKNRIKQKKQSKQ